MSLGRDTGFNLAAALAPVLFTLAATPFYLDAIGAERFGILAICWTIVGALGFASLGMGPALVYRLALMDDQAAAARSDLTWTAILISLAASVIGALLLFALAQAYFRHFLLLPAGLGAETLRALPFLAMLLPVSTLSAVLTGALQGRKRFGTTSIVSTISAGTVAFAPLLAAMFISVELPSLVIALVVGNSLVLVGQLAVAIRIVPLQLPARLHKENVRALVHYGAWMSGTALIAPLLLLSDRFVLGSLRGPAEVTVYVLAFQLVQGVLLFPGSLSSAMLPRLAPLTHDDDVRHIQSSWLAWLNAKLTLMVIAAIAVSAPFLWFWVGPELGSAASPISAILLIGCWLHGIGHIPSAVVVGRSRPDLLTKLLLICLVPYLALLYFATLHFGVMGAAVAWVARAALDPLLFLYTRPRPADLRPVLVSAALVVLAAASALFYSWTSPLYWAIFILIIAVTVLLHRDVLTSSFKGVRTALGAKVGV